MGAFISQKATAYRTHVQAGVMSEVLPKYAPSLELFHYRHQHPTPPLNRSTRSAVVASKGVLIRIAAPQTTPPINQAAIALLRSWRDEDPAQQRSDWDALKQVLEEDTLSDRKLFP